MVQPLTSVLITNLVNQKYYRLREAWINRRTLPRYICGTTNRER